MVQANSTKVKALRARAVLVPMNRPLATAGGMVSQVPLVLIDLECDDGTTGSAYIFCYHSFALTPTRRLVQEMGALVEGEVLAPAAIFHKLRARLRLLGPQGLAMMALAGMDMAAWDAFAKRRELPLARALGGNLVPLPAYNSNGLGIIGAEAAAREAKELVSEGFQAIKLRLGYPDPQDDLAVYSAVRDAVGDGIRIMSDYNQSLTVAEALANGLAPSAFIQCIGRFTVLP